MSDRESERDVVVVGVDGSPSSREALEWAMRQAETTGAKVVAVQAWLAPTDYATGGLLIPEEQWVAEASGSLNAIVSQVAAARPQVPIEQRVVKGHPVTVLVDQARGADLLVVGSRGRGGFAGALLGSVSHHVLHRAPCPVAVVRGKADGRKRTP
ncbi:universal stress protein [Glycomyces albidus]|uniref:Universal stress protein n=1 Tax=Glycomyces albidus TaxID=2656774 RepID=A0A6L5GE18_9ACTN|nr:universal stress protein [Glycomyces albidus]MQM27939.1 universal stress protein [Glycomyces albidus]